MEDILIDMEEFDLWHDANLFFFATEETSVMVTMRACIHVGMIISSSHHKYHLSLNPSTFRLLGPPP